MEKEYRFGEYKYFLKMFEDFKNGKNEKFNKSDEKRKKQILSNIDEILNDKDKFLKFYMDWFSFPKWDKDKDIWELMDLKEKNDIKSIENNKQLPKEKKMELIKDKKRINKFMRKDLKELLELDWSKK